MAKVTGIGGVFFKSTTDHKKLAEWYSKNLGLQLEPWGGAILKMAPKTSPRTAASPCGMSPRRTPSGSARAPPSS